MRISCIIDHLGAGGAQRQLTSLGVFLQQTGHDVSFVTYHKDDFFRPALAAAGIEVKNLGESTRMQRPFRLRRMLRAHQPDAVIAFLEGPCLYAELAGLPSRKWGLIVSERLQIPSARLVPDWKRAFHHTADYVTTNSHATRQALVGMMPRLAEKVVTVYNCLDLELFSPSSGRPRSARGPIRFVVVASYQRRKNLIALVKALSFALGKNPKLSVRIDCYGGLLEGANGEWDLEYFEQIEETIKAFHLQEHFHLHQKENDIVTIYRQADAVILPSLLEGLPNALCEAMACGLPALASRIGDAEILIREGTNGHLFDPYRHEDIGRAILEFCEASSRVRKQMGMESRRIAEKLFAPLSTVSAYT